MSEVMWMIVEHCNGYNRWLDADGHWGLSRHAQRWDGRDQALERLWKARLNAWHLRWTFRLVRITRKPRLSPEAKAAREKLCEAAEAWQATYQNDAAALQAVRMAAINYARAVRK